MDYSQYGSLMDIPQLLSNQAVTGEEQWQNPDLIKKLRDSGALTQVTKADTPYWQFNLGHAINSGLVPSDLQGGQVSPNSFGAQGPMRFSGLPGQGNVQYRDPSLIKQTPWGWNVTPQNNRIEPADKGFLGALPTIGKYATLAALGYGAGTVGAGLLGGSGGAGSFLGHLGSGIGKIGMGAITSGGQFNPLSLAGSMMNFGSPTGNLLARIGTNLAANSLQRRG